MRLLSFDTSSRGLSVAILEDGQILAEANFEGQAGDRPKADRQEAVSLLLPTIDELTTRLGFKKGDYSAIAVGIGPGGFTGVRVAVVTARTLGQALDLPVVGINSLEVAAYEILGGQAEVPTRQEISKTDATAAGAEVAEMTESFCGVIKEASKTHVFCAVYKKGPSLPDFERSRRPLPNSNSTDIGTVSNAAYMPPSSNSTDIGTVSNAAYMPPDSNSTDIGTVSNAAYMPPGSNSTDIGTVLNPAYMPPSSNSTDIGTVLAPTYLPDDAFLASEAFNPSARPASAPITWYVEPFLRERLEAAALARGLAVPELQMLTPVNNVAVAQAKMAFIRLSLRQSALHEGDAVSEPLLLQYSYRLVQPLYLRGASVTLKKGDVIERVETH
jgi:tRNA threonylcarbamoyl adenosine modification protein YeaZ